MTTSPLHMEPEAGGAPVADDAADQVRAALIDLVDEVVSARRAHVAYAVSARIDAFTDQGYAFDDVYQSFVGTALVLAAAASEAARSAGRDGTEAVGWVRDNLGVWASAAAARAGAVQRDGGSSGGANLAEVQNDLREHLLPAVVWFLAGTLAVARGAGEEDWLRRVPAFD
jgi:hypothetical protein